MDCGKECFPKCLRQTICYLYLGVTPRWVNLIPLSLVACENLYSIFSVKESLSNDLTVLSLSLLRRLIVK